MHIYFRRSGLRLSGAVVAGTHPLDNAAFGRAMRMYNLCHRHPLKGQAVEKMDNVCLLHHGAGVCGGLHCEPAPRLGCMGLLRPSGQSDGADMPCLLPNVAFAKPAMYLRLPFYPPFCILAQFQKQKDLLTYLVTLCIINA